MLDYRCPTCGTIFESLEDRAAPSASLPHCNTLAERTMSCPMVITQGVNVTRSTRSDPPPGAMSTQAIADGMSTSEWKARRKAERVKARRAWARSQVS